MPSRTESLAICESWKNKGRWKKAEALNSRLRDDQSSWAFAAGAEPRQVAAGIEPPWQALHAASFLLLASVEKERSQVGVVSFPRASLPPHLVIDDKGRHAIASLDRWHRTLDAGDPTGGRDLAGSIAESQVAKRFTRMQLVSLLQELLDADLIRSELESTARRLIELAPAAVPPASKRRAWILRKESSVS